MKSKKCKNDDYYKELCTKKNTYQEVVAQLKKTNGEVEKDYFGKVSYHNYLADPDRKSLKRKKLAKSKKGLWAHHILEYDTPNLSSPASLRKNKILFFHQEKKNLVYCDLVEHIILHAFIAKETHGERGMDGLLALFGQYKRWYIDPSKKDDLEKDKLAPYRNAVNLTTTEAIQIAKVIGNIVDELNNDKKELFLTKISLLQDSSESQVIESSV